MRQVRNSHKSLIGVRVWSEFIEFRLEFSGWLTGYKVMKLGFINCGQFLGQTERLLAFQNELCVKELVNSFKLPRCSTLAPVNCKLLC
jgi:hypothetical protein